MRTFYTVNENLILSRTLKINTVFKISGSFGLLCLPLHSITAMLAVFLVPLQLGDAVVTGQVTHADAA